MSTINVVWPPDEDKMVKRKAIRASELKNRNNTIEIDFLPGGKMQSKSRKTSKGEARE